MMTTTGRGELFSEDGWPVRAEIKKRAYVVSAQILIEFDLARKRTREHQRENDEIRQGTYTHTHREGKNVNLF